MTASSRWISVAVSLTAGIALTAGSARAAEPDGWIRLAGANRYATAVAVSQHLFPDPPADLTVVLVNGENFPDAVSGGPLGTSGGPTVLLLVHRDTLPDEVIAELARLKPNALRVVGGPAAVSERVAMEAAVIGEVPSYNVERAAGPDRFATSVQVATMWFGGVDEPPAPDVVIASGENYPDALAASQLSSRDHPTPVLLSRRDTLPDAVGTYLALPPAVTEQQVWVVGGPAAISDAVLARVKQLRPDATVTRIGGTNRYDTAALVARARWNPPVENAYYATGENFPDALAAAPAAGQQQAPLLLTRSTCHPDVTASATAFFAPTTHIAVGSANVVYAGSDTCS